MLTAQEIRRRYLDFFLRHRHEIVPSGPLIPPIPGLDSCGFVTAQDMLEGRAVVGAGVLVVGGGMIGCEAAEFLGERGHRVAVVEMKEDIASDVRPEHRRCLLKNLRESQVLVRTGARVERFYPDGVDYVLADGTEGSLRGFTDLNRLFIHHVSLP